MLLDLYFFRIDFNTVCSTFFITYIKICDIFLISKESINTRYYHRVPIYRVNELKLFQKDIRGYQRVSTVLENLWGFCGVELSY